MMHDYVRALTFQGAVGLDSARNLRSEELMCIDRVQDAFHIYRHAQRGGVRAAKCLAPHREPW